MSFNELNAAERFIIQKLSGVNLNAAGLTSSIVKEDEAIYGSYPWQYRSAAEALKFDEKSVRQVITNLKDLDRELPKAVANLLAHFPGVDRDIEGFEALEAAQERIKDDEKKDAFAIKTRTYSYKCAQ